ncbi:MAG: ATP-dependent transcriptional regulator, partial [Paracoccaceae bacterium]|nr:ATP-dependent transcriptional regulator [Paracoccaceae bacterium]
LLSTLMLLEAEALEQAGNATDARSVRLDSLDLARYGFGSEKAVQARLREIASLSRS